LEALKEEEKLNFELNPADVIKEESEEESTGMLTIKKSIRKVKSPQTDSVEKLLREEGMETEQMIKRRLFKQAEPILPLTQVQD